MKKRYSFLVLGVTMLLSVAFFAACIDFSWLTNLFNGEDPTVTKIEVIRNPNKIDGYVMGEEIVVAGGRIRATLSDGSTRPVDMDASGVTFSPSNIEDENEQNITLTYAGETATFTVKVDGDADKKPDDPIVDPTREVENMWIQVLPTNRYDYMQGDIPDLTGGQIGILYTDKTQELIPMTSAGVAIHPQTLTLVGYNDITVSINGQVVGIVQFFAEEPPAPVVTDVTIETYPSRYYSLGMNNIPTGGQLRVHLSDGTHRLVAMTHSSVTVSPTVFSVLGSSISVTVTYSGFDNNYTVEVNAEWFDELSHFDTSLTSFYDTFNGNSLDMTKWAFQNGNGQDYGIGGWGNQEQQSYEYDNVRVQGGRLIIEAKRGGATTHTSSTFSSGKLVTTSRSTQPTGNQNPNNPNSSPELIPFSQTFGRFEARIRLQGSQAWTENGWRGAWPAFWMMPEHSVYGGWPHSGEIDIMEMKGRYPRQTSPAVHFRRAGNANEHLAGHTIGGRWPGWSDWNVSQGWASGRCPGDLVFSGDPNDTFENWQIFGVDWERGRLTFTLNGRRIASYQGTGWHWSGHSNTSRPTVLNESPFDQDFFLILNLAIGGWFDGHVTPGLLANNQGRLSKEVDWVRVYTEQTARTLPGGFGLGLEEHPLAWTARHAL